MRCHSCQHAFCWICRTGVDHKAHNCNKIELSPDASDAAKSLAKWEHFSKRYAMHAASINIQAKLK